MRLILLFFVGFSVLCQAAEWKVLDAKQWKGDRELWKVKGGVITGEAKEGQLAANSFFIWQGGQPGDFELVCEARVEGNNSGVQYRSAKVDGVEFGLAGYQMDMHPNAPYLGMLYEERGRGILCERGKRVERTAGGESKALGEFPRPEVELAKWNEYRIEARGKVVKHFVNGELAAEFHDHETGKGAAKGWIGLQLHAGEATKVEFRNIKLRELEAAEEGDATSGIDASGSGFKVAAGFKLEKVLDVPADHGSWVAMTVDGEGRLICADQYGKIYRIEKGGEIVPLEVTVGGAHGLLWHQGTLYVTVNEDVGGQSGVWRTRERNGKYGSAELLKAMNGRGEHGPHALVPSPDGKWIYFVAGNHTDLPEMDAYAPSRAWGEDQLLPRNPDGRGHARDRMAPGGWIARFRPDGKDWQLVAIGLRNTYDMAFNAEGDLFAYDSDMEWDLGMPWYRPTRVGLVIPGADFGWRNGTGKWPAFYEDSMPPVIDLGPGSPTGVISGKGLKFPARYQRAVYTLDWTFATIRAIHLKKEGAGYLSKSEEMVAGKALPVTDAVAGADGAMYFTAGGRRTQSSLWRLSYVGKEPVTEVAYAKEVRGTMTDGSKIWKDLASPDRVLRQEARLGLERLPARQWMKRLEVEKDVWTIIGASIALSRVGPESAREVNWNALERIDWKTASKEQKLGYLRACGLLFIRTGEPNEGERKRLLERIDSSFPAQDAEMNAELCRMLCYLQAPGIIGRTLDLMENSPPPEKPDWLEVASRNESYGGDIMRMMENHPPTAPIHYAYCLRVVKGPWSKSERSRLFAWFETLKGKQGGMSFTGFMDQIRKDFIENMSPEEREEEKVEHPVQPSQFLQNLPKIEGPGRTWTVAEVEALAAGGLEGRDKERGKRMFQGAMCAACHRFGGEGGGSGPDLSTVGGRFSVRDIAESIIEPDKVVSDQYAFDKIVKNDGSVLVGKILSEKDEMLSVAVSPFDMSQTIEVTRADVKEITTSETSPMPAGLINQMNAEELKDLLAYLTGK